MVCCSDNEGTACRTWTGWRCSARLVHHEHALPSTYYNSNHRRGFSPCARGGEGGGGGDGGGGGGLGGGGAVLPMASAGSAVL